MNELNYERVFNVLVNETSSYIVRNHLKAMTRNSDYDIAFIRKGKETSGTAQNILRRWTRY